VELALHKDLRGLLLVRLGDLTYGNAKGRHKSHSRAWTTVRQGVLVRRQCVAEADGRRCDPEKRRRTLSQKEGAVCVAGGLANRGQTATRKRRRNRDSETASSLPGRDGKVAATVRGLASKSERGGSRVAAGNRVSDSPSTEGIPGCGYRVIVTDTRFSQSPAVSQGRCVSAKRIGAVEKRQGCQRYGEPARGKSWGRKRPPRNKAGAPAEADEAS